MTFDSERGTMILTTNNGNKVRLYAGLYMRTKKQTRFWGWGSRGLGKVWRGKVWGGRRTHNWTEIPRNSRFRQS
jgi:hypothetical protein